MTIIQEPATKLLSWIPEECKRIGRHQSASDYRRRRIYSRIYSCRIMTNREKTSPNLVLPQDVFWRFKQRLVLCLLGIDALCATWLWYDWTTYEFHWHPYNLGTSYIQSISFLGAIFLLHSHRRFRERRGMLARQVEIIFLQFSRKKKKPQRQITGPITINYPNYCINLQH